MTAVYLVPPAGGYGRPLEIRDLPLLWEKSSGRGGKEGQSPLPDGSKYTSPTPNNRRDGSTAVKSVFMPNATPG